MHSANDAANDARDGVNDRFDRANWSYEETVAEVEAIISRLEMGELELADVFEQFSQAVDRLHQCEAFLNHQQQQMDLLVETLLDDPDF